MDEAPEKRQRPPRPGHPREQRPLREHPGPGLHCAHHLPHARRIHPARRLGSRSGSRGYSRWRLSARPRSGGSWSGEVRATPAAGSERIRSVRNLYVSKLSPRTSVCQGTHHAPHRAPTPACHPVQVVPKPRRNASAPASPQRTPPADPPKTVSSPPPPAMQTLPVPDNWRLKLSAPGT